MTTTYSKATEAKKLLKVLRRYPELTKDHRGAIRVLVDELEDITRPTDSKISALREEYTELKGHKTYVEDEKKLKALLKAQSDEVKKLADDTKELTLKTSAVSLDDVFLSVKDDATEEEKKEFNAYREIYFELEGTFLQ